MGSRPSILKVRDDVEDRLKCPICFEQFDNRSHKPLQLPCGHTFGEPCIVRTTNQDNRSVNCSICRHQHVVPTGGFPTNRVVLDLVDLQNNLPNDENQRDLPNDENQREERTRSLLKCPNHANKEVAYVCIDCADTFCTTCAKSSIHMHAKHHVEEVDAAGPVLQEKIQARRRSFEKKLSMIDESPCSSTELAKAEVGIKSMANKIHAETTKWETEQLAMIREMNSFVEAQKTVIRNKLSSSERDLNDMLLLIRQYQQQSDDDDDFMQKIHQRQAEDQSKFDQSLQMLLNKLQAEIESMSAIQSKYLQKVLTTPKQVSLYKVRVTKPSMFTTVKVKHGDVIAVTEVRRKGLLQGIHEITGQQCKFWESEVERIM